MVYNIAFIYLFVSFSVLPGHAICIDTDGHIGMESMWELFLCCGLSTTAQANKAEGFPDTIINEGDNCQDIPADSLLSAVRLIKVDKPARPTLSQAFTINVTTYSKFNNLNRNADCISAPHLNVPLISYSTVSLLI